MIFFPPAAARPRCRRRHPRPRAATRHSLPSPPGKSGARDLLEVRGYRGERLVEPPPYGLDELVTELRHLLEALLEVAPLCRELVEALLLGFVLLLRERVDLAESLAPRLQPLHARRELVHVVSFGDLARVHGVESTLRLLRLRGQPGELHLDLGRTLGCELGRLA